MRKVEVAGRKYGKLTAMWPVGKSKRGMLIWLCCCDCGKLKLIRYGNLITRPNGTCGCSRLGKANYYKHGHTGGQYVGHRSPTYCSYRSAQARCIYTKHQHYPVYGGRGIEFRFASFEDFLACLGPRPIGKTIDRIDPDGHYEPGNVRWATNLQQRHNRRKKTR